VFSFLILNIFTPLLAYFSHLTTMERREFLNLAIKCTKVAIAAPVLAPFLNFAEKAYARPILDEGIDQLLPPRYQLTELSWTGIASYYSDSGCLGCRTDRLMANGERFDEDDLTLAFMRVHLNSLVIVENLNTGILARARVTDRGNFERYGRIADLSQGLKNEIQGTDLTPVRITLLQTNSTIQDNL